MLIMINRDGILVIFVALFLSWFWYSYNKHGLMFLPIVDKWGEEYNILREKNGNISPFIGCGERQ